MIEIAKRALPLLDLTTLGDEDTINDVEKLCQKATSKHGSVAAICVWPRFVKSARQFVADCNLKIAAVANSPDGSTDIDRVKADTEAILAAGGDEVDLVFPYKSWIDGNLELGPWIVSECKRICADKALLKVIIETGELKEVELIKSASVAAINSGADFIKTSTGKTPVSATLEAARVMLQTISETDARCGFKASGGIRDTKTAGQYIALADEIMGPDWVSPNTFRFGASGLLDDLVNVIEGGAAQSSNNGY